VTVLLLARHGETDWTHEKRWQGHADPPLNERGRAQARALAGTLGDVRLDAIYSSDLLRASQTATMVAEGRAIEVRLDPELRENDFGDWTGLTRDEVERRFPHGSLLRRSGRKGWGGGESYEDMADRIVRAVDRIAATHPEELVLVVTHNGPIRAVHAQVFGVGYAQYRQSAKSIKKGSLSAVRLEDGVWAAVASGIPGLQPDVLLTLEPSPAPTRP
jgi:broad specificity phosphatase PhoE